MQTTPFKRAHIFLNAMNAILLSAMPQTLKNIELANLGQYQSRGHGGHYRTKKPKINAATPWKRLLGGHVNGRRECERCLKQMNALGK